MTFYDRKDAGKKLAGMLQNIVSGNAIIFGLTRGGVVVADILAKMLELPMLPIVVRKLGVPIYPELAFGAIAANDVLVTDETVVSEFGLDHEDIQNVIKQEKRELRKRIESYSAKEPNTLKGVTVILVDDGIATGLTMLAAIRYIRKLEPEEIIVAVPVCPSEMNKNVMLESDRFLCYKKENMFAAVGQFYEYFEQIDDIQVKDILENY